MTPFKRVIYKLALLLGVAMPGAAVADDLSQQAIWLDVRSEGEYQSGHIDAALNIPHTQIKEAILQAVPDKDAPVYLYCRSGRRSGIALKVMEELGYTNAVNVGGFNDAKVAASQLAEQKTAQSDKKDNCAEC